MFMYACVILLGVSSRFRVCVVLRVVVWCSWLRVSGLCYNMSIISLIFCSCSV